MRIALLRGGGKRSRGVYTIGAQGGPLHRLVSARNLPAPLVMRRGDLLWSRDAKLIAFQTDTPLTRGCGQKAADVDLYSVPASGGRVRRLHAFPPKRLPLKRNALLLSLAGWSPNSQRVLYIATQFSYCDSRDDDVVSSALYTVRSRGGGRARVARRGCCIDAAAWAPDGGRIAFSTSCSIVSDCQIFLLEQGRVRRLTRLHAEYLSWVWSPTGKEIYYTAENADGGDVVAIDVDSGETRTISRMNAVIEAISSDGQILALSEADESAQPRIVLLSIDGQQKRTLPLPRPTRPRTQILDYSIHLP
jgi:hypothetical protein